MARIYTIDLSKMPAYEAGATLLTLLAYPGAGEGSETLGAVHRALCDLGLWFMSAADPEWASTPQLIRPVYALRDPRKTRRSLRTFERRLRDRMVAARMASPPLERARTGKVPRLPAGMKRPSLNQLCECVLPDSGQSEPENVERRIWRPSLPVIHLATPVLELLRLMAEQGGKSPGTGILLICPVAIEWVVRRAMAYEDLVMKSPELKSAAGKLVRFRPA